MADCAKHKWVKSIVKNSAGGELESASFEILNKKPDGDFAGKFTVDGGEPEDISVNCSNGHIRFERTSGKVTYRYEGKMTPKPDEPDELEITKGNGKRNPPKVSLTNERGAQSQSYESRNAAAPPPPPDDDWIAEQGGTLLTSTAQKP